MGNVLGGTQTDLAVANSGADNVQVFPSAGSGFFNDQPRDHDLLRRPGARGAVPGQFHGQGLGLATLNAARTTGP